MECLWACGARTAGPGSSCTYPRVETNSLTLLAGPTVLCTQLQGLEALIAESGEDEEMKAMAQEERGELLEQASQPAARPAGCGGLLAAGASAVGVFGLAVEGGYQGVQCCWVQRAGCRPLGVVEGQQAYLAALIAFRRLSCVQLPQLEHELLLSLLPKDETDLRGVVVEVSRSRKGICFFQAVLGGG